MWADWIPSIVLPVSLLLVGVAVVLVISKRLMARRVPGFDIEAERVDDEHVEVVVQGYGTASALQVLVDGKIRDTVPAKNGESVVVEASERQEVSVRKGGGV